MAEAKVTALRSVEFGVADVAAAARFFAEVWHLTPVAEENGVHYLRGTGAEHYIVALHPRPRAELVRVNFAAADEAAVDALHARAVTWGLKSVEAPAALNRPGGGYGFAFKDVEGRNLAVSAGIARHADTAPVADRPTKLSHVVFNCGDTDASVRLFTDVLGFQVIDQTRILFFLRCNADHHSIALTYKGGPTLHHVAFEMPELDSVMRGAGRMKESGFPLEWGVGRHGPGNNVFSYFVGPEDFVLEYTAELDQVDDSYRPGKPDDWGFPPGRTDQWGVSGPPSPRIEHAQTQIRFSESLAV